MKVDPDKIGRNEIKNVLLTGANFVIGKTYVGVVNKEDKKDQTINLEGGPCQNSKRLDVVITTRGADSGGRTIVIWDEQNSGSDREFKGKFSVE